jgi:hypothetical protein
VNDSDPKPWLIISGVLAILLAIFFFGSLCQPGVS